MKIAIVANSTWNIYNFRLNILRTLEKQGAEIVVIAPIDKYIFYLNEFKNIRHIPLKMLSRKSKNPYYDLRLFFEIKDIYEREKPDIVLHYTIKPNIYGNLAARFCNIPSICAVTGLGYAFLHNGWVQKLSTFLYRFSFKSAKKVIFENEDDKNYFIQEKITRQTQSVAVNGCGIDTDYYHSNSSGLKIQNKTIFTFIGRFLYDKGIREFVEAAKIIKQRRNNVEFWLVGEIDEQNPATINSDLLLEWVNQRVVIDCGPASDVRVPMEKSSCIILPSYREGTSRVLLEAASMGKPIITTDVPGCKNVVENGANGILCEVANTEALVTAIEQFLALSNEDVLKMGYLGRKKAEEIFNIELISDKILQIINDVLEK
jgi:glycosyltransferase involved in cell wall biosynthesis